MKRSQPGGAQGRVCQLGGTDRAKPQTQEDQFYEELSKDQPGWRVGREPGVVDRGCTIQDLMVCNREPWVCFQESELI